MKAFVLCVFFYACAANAIDIEGDLDGLRKNLQATCSKLVVEQDDDLNTYRENNRNKVRAAIEEAKATCTDDAIAQINAALDAEIATVDVLFQTQKDTFEQLIGKNIEIIADHLKAHCVDENDCKQIMDEIVQAATCNEEVKVLVKSLEEISDVAREGLLASLNNVCHA